MKPTIPNSNNVILTWKEWILTAVLFLAVSFTLYFGWSRWEKIPVERDYRSSCWEERMSDYWAYAQWCRVARAGYPVLLIGDSVVWGQEVPNNETISHAINAELGRDEVANLGIDGLTNAAMTGLFRHYGRSLRGTRIILEFNPLWMSSPSRDLRGRGKARWEFHHPRLVPQLDPRISYYRGLDERIGYLFDHYLKLPPFVRHLMVNNFENKSVSAWLLEHPYRLPLGAISFAAAPMMREKQGLGTAWSSRKGAGPVDAPFVPAGESLQWEFYLKALRRLKKNGNSVFVLLGPFNSHRLTAPSRERFLAMMSEVKAKLDELGYPYFDATEDLLPSEAFADQCHVLKDGHERLARALVRDAGFAGWLGGGK
ncbi:MAG TPA: hypothetical protein P5119_10905 [Candidatus Aminicenantes bacterium]|nr:hypothetical protein [Candidatus Aminicenantes bacterium]HRY65835.1 hypothetical protein [Candidatus Aminicenantes bacterium]HRZ72839.1 hypothetical protein [Candidatus Aminicenantes bacterium]